MAIDAETIANLSPKRKALIILVIAVLIPGLYWYTTYRGKAKVIERLRQEYSQKQAKLNENEAIARNLPRFKEEVGKLNKELARVVQELPNSREIPNLIETISNLGSLNGLQIVYIKPQSDVNKGFYAEVPIQIKAVGGYHEMGLFLDSLSKLPRIINVSNINLGNAKEDKLTGAVVLNISALATTYRYIEKEG